MPELDDGVEIILEPGGEMLLACGCKYMMESDWTLVWSLCDEHNQPVTLQDLQEASD